jgi:hypothetical protein
MDKHNDFNREIGKTAGLGWWMVRENTYWFENLFLVKSTKLFA